MTPPTLPLAPSELVLRFLASIGRPAEAHYYLSLFRSEFPERFAIIHVADAVMRQAADALVVDLRFLAELGLRPIIAFGAVKPRNAARQANRVRNLLSPFVPCAVVSPEEAGATARRGEIALVPAVGGGVAAGTPAAGVAIAGALLSGAPAADDLSERADGADDRGDRNDKAEEDIPAVDAGFDALADMATSLGSHKIVFLGRRSGLQPRDGRVVSLLDVTTELDDFLRPGQLPATQAKLLRQVARILQRVPQPLTVSVTSPLDLLRELFTVKGAGTLLRRGARVVRHAGFTELDLDRLVALVEEAFGRPLLPSFSERPTLAIYLADDYRGAAIVTDAPLGPYLSKFAVDVGARGEGIGRDLWRAMSGDYPRLFWRSRPANPITAWYRENCDGLQRIQSRSGDWVVLWRGLAPSEIPDAIAYCRELPADFTD
jgi:bifunctional N-acetylglutamate synthase/kinase